MGLALSSDLQHARWLGKHCSAWRHTADGQCVLSVPHHQTPPPPSPFWQKGTYGLLATDEQLFYVLLVRVLALPEHGILIGVDWGLKPVLEACAPHVLSRNPTCSAVPVAINDQQNKW